MKAVASDNYRRLKIREEREMPHGLDALSFALTGSWRNWRESRERLVKRSQEIDRVREQWASRTDTEIIEEAKRLAPLLLRKSFPEDALVTGLACTALAAQRTLGLSPYLAQLQGASALFDGSLAEMATGEGKSLSISLAATLMALTRLPTHVITSNDYLAERDAKELAPLYGFFGLRSDFVVGAKEPTDRARGYAADITYTTPKEVLADFLRDKLKIGRIQDPTRQLIRRLGGLPNQQSNLVLRGLHFGIVDEADSVLIDEAVTPLIISKPVGDPQLQTAMNLALQVCEKLVPGQDYEVNQRFRDIHVPEPVFQRLLPLTSQFPPWWRSAERFREAIRLALMAREFYHRDIHYVVQDGKIELIDEFTGRIMPDRTWQAGIHQAVEAKENIPISPANESLASLSFQRFFRCYPHLSGLSGTVREASAEFWFNYHLPTVSIATHRPILRYEDPELIVRTREEKWDIVASEVQDLRARGRPVLIGTRSIQASEELAAIFRKMDIPFRLLNAVRHAEEAQIIGHAGEASQVTITTNMAGRGTDIKLGPGVAERGGLHVIVTERNDSARIDRQLIGRSGRQGDPGSFRYVLSLEDELLQKNRPMKALATYLQENFPTLPASRAAIRQAFLEAQRRTERAGKQMRLRTLKNDTWLDENLTFAGRSSFI
jgi:preprotein translocase subunit SecA